MTKRLLPLPVAEVDPRTVYEVERPARPDRPYVVVNMVASVDGAVALDGVTKALGSPTDQVIFHHLRGLADVVMAGASTVRAERYGPLRLPDETRAARLARGQAAQPTLIVVSRSLSFDWDARLFGRPDVRPLLLIPADAEPSSRVRAERVADLLAVGEGSVDLAAALQQLRARQVELLLCEGGPTLNAALLQNDLVDELCLTISPVVAATSGLQGIFSRAGGGPPLPLDLIHVLEEDSFLYLRYRFRRTAS